MAMFFWDKLRSIAEEHADRPAVVDGDKVLDYQTLVRHAVCLGEKLKQDGVLLETPVGLALDKSAEYIIALLAVWYAGGAFVPLPPCLPLERRKFIEDETGMQHVISSKDILPASEMPFSPAPVRDDTLAYIIYTSGSTGEPKGVMVEHRGIVPFITEQKQAFQTNSHSRYLFYLSVGFDASISDIGVALLSGSALVIAPQDKLGDGQQFVRLMRDKKITHTDIPPSLLKIIDPCQMPKFLETIIIGGETCPPKTVREWAEKFRVVNVYGPTETTVCTSMVICDAKTWKTPLIGDAMAHVRYRVLNGQLYIGGHCLARGYLNRPGLTAEKFVFLDGERFYKTGDNVKQNKDGTILFLGRIDRQFKLRGQLIEPEEIEMRLCQHIDVDRAVVMKRSLRKGGTESLLAFIVGKKPDDLESFLRERLPSWMVPQHFEVLDSFPETVTGKIDFTALKTVPLSFIPSDFVLPATKTEQDLFDVWQNVLKHGDFGVAESFFAVGGDSLNAMNLTLEAEKYGLAVSLPLLMAHPVLRDLAAALDNKEKNDGGMSCDILKKDVAFGAGWQNIFTVAKKRPIQQEDAPQNIFLTGATGFLGARLLEELLKQTTARIYCLVRAKDQNAAKARLPLKSTRVQAVCGDITQKYFGLPQKQWTDLAEKVDTIYHCAALVNIVQPYDVMYDVNVGGVQEVLSLACCGKRKHIHYASTLSVFVATDRNTGTALESDVLQKTGTVYGGYAQTKWAAEYMLLQVPDGVCKITYYRFGLIAGDSQTGKTVHQDFLGLFVDGMVSLGVFPETVPDISLDMTPVDYAVTTMAYLSLNGAEDVYHIANKVPLSLERLFGALRRECPNVQIMPWEEWQLFFKNKTLTQSEAAAYLALCRGMDGFDSKRTMDLFQATDIVFDTQNTDKDYSEQCPIITDDLLQAYLRFILKQNENKRSAA